MSYVSLHTHTTYSLLDSTSSPVDFISKAKEFGMSAIAFTEHGNLYNWIKKKQYCDKAGIKYIHGIEFYVTCDEDEKTRDNYHMIALAKNKSGVDEINSLVTLSTTPEQMYYAPRITAKQVANLSNNVIVLGGCLGGIFYKCTDQDVLNRIDYIEVQPHMDERQIDLNLKALNSGKKIVATGDFHEVSKYKSECRKVLKASAGIEYDNEDVFDLVFKSYEDFKNDFIKQNILSPEQIELALSNTNEIANQIEDFNLDLTYKYPQLYDNACELLSNKIHSGLMALNLSDEDMDVYLDRIQTELDVMKQQDAEAFILFMSEVTEFCRDNNIGIGYGRGSVTGSLICYLTGITDVDAIKWGTNFTRFMNVNRISLMDIDSDLEASKRHLVFKYISDRFGFNMSCNIITFMQLSIKSIIDAVGRALKIPHNEVTDIKKGYAELELIQIKLKKKFENDGMSEDEFNDENEIIEKQIEEYLMKYESIFYYYEGLKGTVVATGIHPAGIIGSPMTLNDSLALKYDNKKECFISSCDMKAVDSTNYVKYDILSLSTIDKVSGAFNLILSKLPLAKDIDWNDEKVFKEIDRSPVGLFQFESDSAWHYLKKFEPRTVQDIALISAVIRPSCASFRDKLIDRVPNIHKDLRLNELFSDSYGYLVYQEQQISFLHKICGFTEGEADIVRRAIGKKDPVLLAEWLPRIEQGYIDNANFDKELAKEYIKEFMQVFIDAANYSFSYNHAIAYSMLTYMTAYCRLYMDVEYVCSYLNIAKTDEDTVDGVKLAKLCGIEILNAEFGYSSGAYTVSGKKIYKGIGSIVNVSDNVGVSLLELSKQEGIFNLHFVDLLLELKKVKDCNIKKIDTLIKVDYFKKWGRPKKLANFLSIFNDMYGKQNVQKKDIKPGLLKMITKCIEDGLEGFKEQPTRFGVDMVVLLKKIFNVLQDEDYDAYERIVNELSYLNYIQSNDIDKDKIGYVKTNVTKNGGYLINDKWYVLNEGLEKLNKGDIIYMEYSTKRKIGKYTNEVLIQYKKIILDRR